MQNEQQKKTAFESSAATDEKQPLINSTNSITENTDICNSFDDDIFKEFKEEGRKDYMRTIDMNELFDMPLKPRVPIIDAYCIKGCICLQELQRLVNHLQWHKLDIVLVKVSTFGTKRQGKVQYCILP